MIWLIRTFFSQALRWQTCLFLIDAERTLRFSIIKGSYLEYAWEALHPKCRFQCGTKQKQEKVEQLTLLILSTNYKTIPNSFPLAEGHLLRLHLENTWRMMWHSVGRKVVHKLALGTIQGEKMRGNGNYFNSMMITTACQLYPNFSN